MLPVDENMDDVLKKDQLDEDVPIEDQLNNDVGIEDRLDEFELDSSEYMEDDVPKEDDIVDLIELTTSYISGISDFGMFKMH